MLDGLERIVVTSFAFACWFWSLLLFNAVIFHRHDWDDQPQDYPKTWALAICLFVLGVTGFLSLFYPY